MQTQVLIIGQGLAGSWLSYWLEQAGINFLVLDENWPATASKVSSGIINPVTGRRMVKTWMADELLPFAETSYNAMGELLGAGLFHATEMLDFFSAPDRRLSFEQRAAQFENYLFWPTDEHAWLEQLDYPFGYGIISPVYRVEVQLMLSRWRSHLEARHAIQDDQYDPGSLKILANGISYKDINAEYIIFCDGVQAMHHHYFQGLPFAFNKGEALVVRIPGLSQDFIYKKTNVLVPLGEDLFWVGSNYDRSYHDDQPTKEFYDTTQRWLNQFVKLPFAVDDHIAGIRPTTVERRPFVGLHPQVPQVGILNGLGTKGVSLAPFLAKQLAELIVNQAPVIAEADVKQYSRILQRFA